MNKLLFGAALMGVAASLTATAVFAASNSKVTITTDYKSAGLPYNVADGVTAELTVSSDVLSIASANSTKEYKEKSFSITSVTGNFKPVDIKLVLKANMAENASYSPIDYYDIKLADKDGNYIYNSEDDNVTGEARLEIDLGTFNQSFSSEKKDYVISYKINPDFANTIDKTEAARVKFVVEATPIAVPIPTVSSVTSAPATDAPTSVSGTSSATKETESPAPTEEAGEYSAKTYVCGKDIEPGRYLVNGNAKVVIKDKKGTLLKEVVLSDGSLGDFGGVDKFIVSLESGDTVTVTALTKDTKASVNFRSVAVKPSESPSPSATAKPSTASKTSATAKPNTTNPKTGDNGIAIPAIVTVMLLSAGFIGVLEVLKRRNFN